jgi:hypothetical protein
MTADLNGRSDLLDAVYRTCADMTAAVRVMQLPLKLQRSIGNF